MAAALEQSVVARAMPRTPSSELSVLLNGGGQYPSDHCPQNDVSASETVRDDYQFTIRASHERQWS